MGVSGHSGGVSRRATPRLNPISRLEVGNSPAYGKIEQNPYLGIVFAMDGMDGKKVRDRLVRYPEDYGENLPDYILNLEKKYMISRWMRKIPLRSRILIVVSVPTAALCLFHWEMIPFQCSALHWTQFSIVPV